MKCAIVIGKGGSGDLWGSAVKEAFGLDSKPRQIDPEGIKEYKDIIELLEHRYDVIILPLTLPHFNSLSDC